MEFVWPVTFFKRGPAHESEAAAQALEPSCKSHGPIASSSTPTGNEAAESLRVVLGVGRATLLSSASDGGLSSHLGAGRVWAGGPMPAVRQDSDRNSCWLPRPGHELPAIPHPAPQICTCALSRVVEPFGDTWKPFAESAQHSATITAKAKLT